MSLKLHSFENMTLSLIVKLQKTKSKLKNMLEREKL